MKLASEILRALVEADLITTIQGTFMEHDYAEKIIAAKLGPMREALGLLIDDIARNSIMEIRPDDPMAAPPRWDGDDEAWKKGITALALLSEEE